MLQVVAVDQVFAFVAGESHQYVYDLGRADVDSVLPAGVVLAGFASTATQHLERRQVDVHRVLHVGHEGPDLVLVKP
ncbi:MAG: hypothetical protein QOH50_3946 [Kribbellaceae bacterium]|nr:hypothetical protein [Kribbellaceae bacterium]